MDGGILCRNMNFTTSDGSMQYSHILHNEM
uniref:Uncharacterized protein n=3 Tax=Vitis vinifera TaxID=29760 RepID=F6GV42_VITVI